MAFEPPRFRWSFFTPRFWLLWCGLGLAWLVVQLPYPVLLPIGRWVGRMVMRFGKGRRAIAERNLELCFPELDPQERAALLRKNFESMGISVLEVGISWWWPKWRVYRLFELEGEENLKAVEGQGALMLCLHFSTLEIGAGYLGHIADIDCMYRRHKNPLFDWVQQRGRQRHSLDGETIEREDVRTMIRSLRKKHRIWYAPDQDYGRKQSLFVPFFGVTAATVTATSRFARLGNARVLPCIQTRLPDGRGYRLSILPPLDDFPGDDEFADAKRVNELIEQEIRKQPEQYMWLHRRFKTRPEGEPRLY
ncbi:LpxL/LpxP family Kdo(2)-lipid IV(A) lauroyl/palmitoleoyl acyltransferase [Aestuariirhabdus sp. Z084]|uniref:LpxL/LpxP family Kdo(2)-lipid IV(A) lauroyl/palmitoleoyl acyltransferase n=1 Tax=Aestuariirhabdus haliotis TaxID=2918751 RepID=UPI00201B36EE|nr:LpxL/LpxP family Kdo(2)-lipid IV(A) lauroyl/palmitoleoyl acyltransferase [Aestuariirhabdus haliotis]MCL6417304.1 LpxL/LpxP family Kdo(2)-lipid IV(A) lauroyl/palmitoleoyl acyltransferase [Aestuariirhabdus haliotis]MCL6421249.1 LpxL/LpxP family Kdo(2)-lipid IV(A) lauroyl/palmitoleoyl acyltransferase [Aestuariirhabdus haliotis]